MNNMELIEMMLAKPYVMTGGESLTALKFFLNGYAFCQLEKMMLEKPEPKYSLLPVDWRLFTDYVRCSLTYNEPKADWYDILMTYFGDKEGHRMFVGYFDSFRKIELRSYRKVSLDDEQQAHYISQTGAKRVPRAMYIASIEGHVGWLSAVEFDDEIMQQRCIFSGEDKVLAAAKEMFGGELSWFEITGVDKLHFKKEVRLELPKKM
ncbi:MAG TPA: hypothetical protein DHV89_05475 [Ruminococcus sp.]|nr:hypothetical protein [Ruminococcus sp.]